MLHQALHTDLIGVLLITLISHLKEADMETPGRAHIVISRVRPNLDWPEGQGPQRFLHTHAEQVGPQCEAAARLDLHHQTTGC